MRPRLPPTTKDHTKCRADPILEAFEAMYCTYPPHAQVDNSVAHAALPAIHHGYRISPPKDLPYDSTCPSWCGGFGCLYLHLKREKGIPGGSDLIRGWGCVPT